jgi:hypothetical protein
MSRSIMARGGAILALASISSSAAGLSSSSGTAGVGACAALAWALSPPLFFPLAAAAAAADASLNADARECAEPGGTCVNGEGGAVLPDAAEVDDRAGGDPAPTAVTPGDDDDDGGVGSDETIPTTALTPPRHAPNGDRLIGSEELALHTSKESRIWLSILGKVYDVTDGEDFYGALKGGYKFYAGRDASPCFASGKNTPEGAQEKLEEWEVKKQLGVYEWSTFYENHEKYVFVGVLAGSRYYDEYGNETELRRKIVEECSVAKKIADEEREKKKADRLAARLARKKATANSK